MYLEAGKKCQELKTTNMSKIHQMEQLSRVHDLKFKIVSYMNRTDYIYGTCNHQQIARSKFPFERFDSIVIVVHACPIAI